MALSTPNPSLTGLPGAAWQPGVGMGMPAEAYWGQGFMGAGGGAPTGGLSPYAQQLAQMQASAGQPLGTVPSQFVQQQLAAWNQAPNMFSRPGDAGARLGPQNLVPREAPRPLTSRTIASHVPTSSGPNINAGARLIPPKAIPPNSVDALALELELDDIGKAQRGRAAYQAGSPMGSSPVNSAVAGQSVRPTPAMQGAGQVGGKIAQGAAGAEARVAGSPVYQTLKMPGAYAQAPTSPISGLSSLPPPPTSALPPPPAAARTGLSKFLPSWSQSLTGKQPGGWMGRAGTTAAGFAIPIGLGMAAEATGDPSIGAAAAASQPLALLGPAPAAAAAAGVGTGDYFGRMFTKELGQTVGGGERSTSWNPMVNTIANHIGAYEDQFGDTPIGLPDQLVEVLSRGERGMADLPVIGGLFGGGEDEGDQQGDLGSAVGSVRPISPDEFMPYLERSGISKQGVQEAYGAYQQAIEQNRMMAELGLIEVPDFNEDGTPKTNEDGTPVTRALLPSEADQYSAQLFAQSIPDLIASDQARIDAQLRAASYRAMVDKYMGPTLEMRQNLGDQLGAMTANLPVSPEYQSAFANYASMFDQAATQQANADMMYAQLLPDIMAMQSQQQADQAYQSQIDQALMQEQVNAYIAANPQLFPSRQQAADPFALTPDSPQG